MMNKPKRIVITGALGHIGSKLVHDLPVVFPNTQIIMIDNLITQRYCSLFNLPSKGKYKFIMADILDIDLEKILMLKDIVIHLAAMTDATKSFENQKEIERVNYTSTIKLANACSKIGCSLFFPSSTSVYGTTKKIVYENCPKSDLKPQSPYAESKLRSEKYLKKVGKKTRLKFIICRFGTITGISKGMRFHTAVNKFCWQAVINQPLSVWKTALHQKRPYLSLSDASKAIQFIIKKNIFDQKIYNVVTDNMTVNNVINKIKKIIPKIRLQLIDSRIMNNLSYEVSTALFQKIGFKFSGNISNDVNDTVKLLKKAHDHNL